MSATAATKKQKPLKRHPSKLKQASAYTILAIILISIVAVLFAFPLYWIITGSFKTGAAINATTPEWWPSQWVLTNYQKLFAGKSAPLWQLAVPFGSKFSADGEPIYFSVGPTAPAAIRWMINTVFMDTGLLKENAVQFYSSVLEAPSQEEVEGYIKYSAKKLNECGFTGVQSDDLASLPGKNWRRIMASYKALDARGELSIRHYEQCLFERAEDAKAFIEEGYRTGQRGDHFTVGPMKLIQDGSLGARTAAMNEPYEDSPGNTGIITFSQEELDDLFAFFDRHQMQAAVHCIGDRAMDMVIEAAAKSPYRKDNKKGRHGIVHCQITNPRILQGMKDQDLLAYIQPVFIDLDMNTVEPAIGAHRMDKVYAWKSMLDMGIHTSGGSDAPVVSFDAMENIYFAVTRKNISGQPQEGWIPSEKMSVDEAVKLFTKNAAYASYTEDENGTIEVEKNADFVVLEKDIYKIDPDEIKTTKVDMTVLGGEIVYERKVEE